jgi:hypothetical protein
MRVDNIGTPKRILLLQKKIHFIFFFYLNFCFPEAASTLASHERE